MPIPSVLPPLVIPDIDLFSFLQNLNHKKFPDEKIIYADVESGKSLTWSEVFSSAMDFGRGLISDLKLSKADVVAIALPNCAEFPCVVLGSLWAGATISPANPNYASTELEHQLKNCGAKIVVTQWSLSVVKACSNAGIAESHIILIGNEIKHKGDFLTWRTILDTGSSSSKSVSKAVMSPKSDVSFIVYSSGTTGLPKGVMLSHYNVIASVLQIQAGEQGNLTSDGSKTTSDIPVPANKEGDKILACLPFFHIYGLTHLVLQPLYCGISTIIMNRFDITQWCQLVQNHKITYSYIVPPIAVLLASHDAVKDYNLRSVRMANSGAAPLPRDLITKVFQRTGIRIKQSYGLSEASPGAFAQRWDDWRASTGSAGLLLPNMEVKFMPLRSDDTSNADNLISDNTNEEMSRHQVGELYLRGPNIFLGYHKNPTETAACLSSDGWLRTGDAGYLDQAGNLFITDRIKELIKYKGFQIAPAELEACLRKHPLVGDVAVVGIESQDLGTEVPRAYVVRSNIRTAAYTGASDDNSSRIREEAALVDWIARRMTHYKWLRGGVRFVNLIPRSATGKILRRELKEGKKGYPSPRAEVAKL